MAFGDDDNGRGISLRGGRGGALADMFGGPGPGQVMIHTSRGSSAIPGSDMQVYEEMAAAVANLNALADRMNGLHGKDDETRRLMQRMRVLAIEMRGELERRITG